MPLSVKPIPSVPNVDVDSSSSLLQQSSKRQTSQYLKTMQTFPHIFPFLNLLPKEQGSPWLPSFRPGTILKDRKSGKIGKSSQTLYSPSQGMYTSHEGLYHIFPSSEHTMHISCSSALVLQHRGVGSRHETGLKMTKIKSTRKTLNYHITT